MSININSKLIASILLAFAGLFALTFVLLYLAVDGFSGATKEGPLALLNIDAEVSIPTWYAQTLLFISSPLLFFIGRTATAFKKHWYGLSVIFLYMSIDEGAAIHELFTTPIRDLLGVTSGPLYFAWFVLFLPIAVLIAVVYIKFLQHLPKRTALLMMLSGVVFISGAVGLEMVGGALAAQSAGRTLAYTLSVATEEFLEMAGATLFFYTLLNYCHKNNVGFNLKFK